MQKQAHKCVICGNRPSPIGQYCQKCTGRIEKERRDRRNESPVQFLTYRGVVVALYRNGKDGEFRGLVIKRNPDKLPKQRTINLNMYQKGYTRQQIKSLKAKVLALASVGII